MFSGHYERCVNDTNSEIAAASVIGRDHRRVDRPCQDAYAIRRAGDVTVAVVSDGCGSGAHSELGARLGANVLATALAQGLARGDDRAWDDACDAVLACLAELVPVLADDLETAIGQHLLFTLVAVAMTPAGAAMMVIGDGVVIVDGVVQVLDAGPDNAPAYLAYELLGRAPERVRIAAPDAREIVVATDGAAAIADELRALDDRFFANPDALRRKLVLAGREPGVLADDCTVVAVRRRTS